MRIVAWVGRGASAQAGWGAVTQADPSMLAVVLCP